MCFGGGGGSSQPRSQTHFDNFGEAIPSNLEEQRKQSAIGSMAQQEAFGASLGSASNTPTPATPIGGMAKKVG
jgi:hypothetical protein